MRLLADPLACSPTHRRPPSSSMIGSITLVPASIDRIARCHRTVPAPATAARVSTCPIGRHTTRPPGSTPASRAAVPSASSRWASAPTETIPTTPTLATVARSGSVAGASVVTGSAGRPRRR
jgi:hypothetical protein